MVDILKPAGRGAYRISTLNGKVEVDCVASVFLAANFSSQALSSFISSLIGEIIASFCLLLEVTDVRLTSRCVRISSPQLRRSRSNILRDSLWGYSMTPLFCDLAVTPGRTVRPEAILFRGGSRWSCLITSSFFRSDWSYRLSLRSWNLLRVRTTVQGLIATRSGPGDLLLDLCPFYS